MRFLFFIAAIAALVWVLHRAFPYALADSENVPHVIYGVILLMVMGSSVFLRSTNLSRTARDGMIWVGIILLGVLAMSYKDNIMGSRLMGALVPSRPIVEANGSIAIRSGEGGHFFLDAKVNGVVVKFMVDTGATDIVLAPADAERVGYITGDLEYDHHYQTANGIVKGAEVQMESFEVGGLKIQNLPASVNGAPMGESLLGMRFLKLFKQYKVEDGRLILVP